MLSLVQWLGVLLLAINGSLAGWLLCALGAALGLLIGADQLTQSAFLLSCAVAALCSAATNRQKRDERLRRVLPHVVRCITLTLYLLAVTHKLNRDFFDPAVSCANGGLTVLERALADRGLRVHVPGAELWPIAYVVVELGVVLLLRLRPASGVTAAAWMHLPLTIVFAPSFALVMMSGWICFLTEAQLRGLVRTLRTRGLLIATTAIAAGGVASYLFARGRWQTDPDWCVKELLLWFVAVWLFEWRTGLSRPTSAWQTVPPRWLGKVFVAVWLLNGLTPYLGLQFQHTGAMLSNLRIDQGCWNSLWASESWRVHEPYIRIDHLTADGTAPRWADVAYGKLYTRETMTRARRQWCSNLPRPVAVSGTQHGAPFAIDDLCDEWPFGRSTFEGLRRFQVNLRRDCPHACVH